MINEANKEADQGYRPFIKAWLAALIVGQLLAGLVALRIVAREQENHVPSVASPPRSTLASTTVLASTTTRAKTAAEWAAASRSYVAPMVAAFDELQRSSGSLDLPATQAAAGRVADVARGFRLSLESAGPVPASIAVQGRAVIEATRELETRSRTLAACVGLADCTATARSEAVAFDSWGSAVSALTEALKTA